MDAAVHGNHYGVGRHQEQEETTPSDVSERPSVDDVESDTGSTGALETRSLKDHKGNGASLHVQQSRHWKYLLVIKTLVNILLAVFSTFLNKRVHLFQSFPWCILFL